MNVDHRAADSVEERRSEDLHVAGHHHQIDIAPEQFELTLFGLGAGVAGGGDVEERHTEGAHPLGQIGVVGDHHGNRHLQLATAVAPQQIQQAVVFLGRHDRDPLGLGGLGEAVVDGELTGHGAGEVALEPVDRGGQPRQVKDRALQEGSVLRRGGVLVQRNDVRAGLGQKGAHRGDQPRPVVAAKQQPANIGGQRRTGGRLRVLIRLGRCWRHLRDRIRDCRDRFSGSARCDRGRRGNHPSCAASACRPR